MPSTLSSHWQGKRWQ